MNDPLQDVKAIAQVVGYATNAGIQWCVLSNGVQYKIYRTAEAVTAPEKLLYEVSLDPKDAGGLPIEQVASQIARLSRDSLASGVLDDLGEEIFTTAKVRKALNKLFLDPQPFLVRSIRRLMPDDALTHNQIKLALARIWQPGVPSRSTLVLDQPRHERRLDTRNRSTESEYPESHHTGGKPKEVVELFRLLDRLCHDLAPGQVIRKYNKKTVSWSHVKRIFCSAHLYQSGLRVWLKLDPIEIRDGPAFARDVSRIGHWGPGDVELVVDSAQRLVQAERLIRSSFERSQPYQRAR